MYLFFIMPKEIITINLIYFLCAFLNVKSWFKADKTFHRVLMDIAEYKTDE